MPSCVNGVSVWTLGLALGWTVTYVGGASAALHPAPIGFVAVTTGSGWMQLSSFRLDGSGERRLTVGPGNHHYPSVSPDGRQVAFTSDSSGQDEIYALDVTNSEAQPRGVTARPLTAESPSWSPDGRSISYSATLLGQPAFQIYVARADGNHTAPVTHTTDSGNTQPVFSPDGKRIAYINGREGMVAGPAGQNRPAMLNRIWVMNVDGSNARPLSDGPLDAYPAWLDSSTILFAREDPTTGTSYIVSITLDGRQRVVSPSGTSLIEPKPIPGASSYGATENSPSGLRLVMVTFGGVTKVSDPSSNYIITPIAVPTEDGNVFTMSWIPAPPAALAGSRPQSPLGLVAATVAILGAALWATWRSRRRTTLQN